MSRNYKFQNPEGVYFVSFAVVAINAIKENPRESRKDFLLERFEKAGAMSSNVVHYQFWRHDNKPHRIMEQ